ncbi:MAG: hypothetical protein AAB809_01670 [Patescibacteria group bacterium]
MKADPTFLGFIGKLGSHYATNELSCYAFQVEAGETDVAIIRAFGLEPDYLDAENQVANQVCALLAHLGGEGAEFLQIPEGQDEINVILGYAVIFGVRLVLFVEHELKEGGGVEEIHLHVRPLNCWRRHDAPVVLVVG